MVVTEIISSYAYHIFGRNLKKKIHLNSAEGKQQNNKDKVLVTMQTVAATPSG